MASGPPPGSAGPSGTNGQRIAQISLQQQAAQSTNPGNIYSFSVHQPYTNWPLHAPGGPYAPSWYPLPPQAYGHPPRSFKEAHVQTDARRSTNEEGVPHYRRHWDAALSTFLKNAGLHQALRGFRDDMMMLSDEWERERVPIALQAFVKELSEINEDAKEEDALPEKPLEDRKLDYVRAQSGVTPQTPSNLTKSISRFLKESRKRNDASNRSEFLISLAEKRRKLNEQVDSSMQLPDRTVSCEGSSSIPATGGPAGPDATMNESSLTQGASAIPSGSEVEVPPSCARTDAKPQNRDVQMKYDIAKNEDGPLKRTMKASTKASDSNASTSAAVWQAEKGKQRAIGGLGQPDTALATAERNPGLADRFKDIESHLAVRYVPSPPHSLVDRIRFLEDHIIKLEKDYPPWAALHFNQPNRGWPPPPRLTPIIVAPHLTSIKADQDTASSSAPSADVGVRSSVKAKQAKTKSSLHRAVMEKLEIQRAIGDLAGGSGG